MKKSLEFSLKSGEKVLIDAEDYFKLKKYNWRLHSNGYAIASVDRKRILMHRFLLDAPKGMVVDHISGNIIDNRKSNLRLCSVRQNLLNRKPHKGATSKYKGVRWVKERNKWRVQITVNKKQMHLGYFEDEVEAAKTYNEASEEFFGDFGRPNKI